MRRHAPKRPRRRRRPLRVARARRSAPPRAARRHRRRRRPRLRVAGRDASASGDAAAAPTRHGVATIRVPRRRDAATSPSARSGFGDAHGATSPSGSFRRVTVRVYRPDLQWPLYGATPARAQAQVHIRLRPPFRTVWARAARRADRVPGGRRRRRRVHRQRARDDPRDLDALRERCSGGTTTPHGKMASSPAVVGRELVVPLDGRRTCACSTARRAGCAGATASARRSSRRRSSRNGIDYFGAWNGRLVRARPAHAPRCAGRATLGAKITSSAAIAGGTLFIGDYAGRLWALVAAHGRDALGAVR